MNGKSGNRRPTGGCKGGKDKRARADGQSGHNSVNFRQRQDDAWKRKNWAQSEGTYPANPSGREKSAHPGQPDFSTYSDRNKPDKLIVNREERVSREQSGQRRYQSRVPLHPEERLGSQVIPAPENMLIGRNPIREALKAGRHFEALYVAKGDVNGSAREIVRNAKEQRVLVKEVDRRALDAMSPGHQGLIAVVSAHQYASIDDMLMLARERGEDPLLLVLDGVTDPHNFGAITRSAECCGAHGVVICERRAVGMTPGAAKAAAGAFEHIPVARVTNVVRTIDDLKKAGLWIYAADQSDGKLHYAADLKGAIALVVGDESEGVPRLALEKCDGKVSIPIRGKIESLNASVAAGILLYEVLRQREQDSR